MVALETCPQYPLTGRNVNLKLRAIKSYNDGYKLWLLDKVLNE